MTTTITLTHIPESAGSSGLDELAAFYTSNPSNRVKERDPEQLLRAIADRKVYVVRDSAGALCGVCGAFEYGDGTYREIGGVRVILNGFGLQGLLMSLAVAMEHQFDPPAEALYAATAHDNNASIISIERAGFHETKDLGARRMAALGLDQLDVAKRYFLLPSAGLSQAEAYVCGQLSSRRIIRPAGALNLDIQPPFTDLLALLSRSSA
jgi:RimJ/RimL family protein N-acetyltransferase